MLFIMKIGKLPEVTYSAEAQLFSGCRLQEDVQQCSTGFLYEPANGEYKLSHRSADSRLLWSELKKRWKKPEVFKVNYKIKLNLYRELILWHLRIHSGEEKQGVCFPVPGLSIRIWSQLEAWSDPWASWWGPKACEAAGDELGYKLSWVTHCQAWGISARSVLHWSCLTLLCPGISSSAVPMGDLEMRQSHSCEQEWVDKPFLCPALVEMEQCLQNECSRARKAMLHGLWLCLWKSAWPHFPYCGSG